MRNLSRGTMKRLFSRSAKERKDDRAAQRPTGHGDRPVSLLHSLLSLFLPRPIFRRVTDLDVAPADVAVRPPMGETARGKEDQGPRQRPVFCRVGASCERFSHAVDNACVRSRARVIGIPIRLARSRSRDVTRISPSCYCPVTMAPRGNRTLLEH